MPSGMRGEVLRGSTLVSRSPHRNAVPSGGHFLPPRSRTHVPPRRPAPSQRPGASLRPGDRRTLSVHRIHHLSICTRQCQGCAPRAGVVVQFIIMCERANKLRRTYFFTQKRRRGYEIRVLKARGAADYRGNVRKGRKAGRDCRACRQVPSDHIPRARARQDRGNGLPLSSRV